VTRPRTLTESPNAVEQHGAGSTVDLHPTLIELETRRASACASLRPAFEHDDRYVVELEVPGVTSEEVKVEVRGSRISPSK